MTSHQSHQGWVLTITALVLGSLTVFSTARAEDKQDAAKKDAVAAMETWLGEADAGSYAKTWTDSSKAFQKAITSEKWVEALTKVRSPLGKLVNRKLDSALYQDGVNRPNAKPLPGKYVVAQFDTSFENLKYARETVTFQLEDDGSWRAAGYYIKPQ